MNADIRYVDNGHQTSVPACIVWFRWHDSCKPGQYIVNLQVARGMESVYDSGVFSVSDVLRHAVIDDFGTLRGVS